MLTYTSKNYIILEEVMDFMGSRIQQLRKYLKMTQREFADRVGVTRDMIANYEIDRVLPHKMFLDYLCKTFYVSPQWLYDGIGEMFPNDTSNLAKMAAIFENLRPEFQEYVIKQIAELIELQEKIK